MPGLAISSNRIPTGLRDDRLWQIALPRPQHSTDPLTEQYFQKGGAAMEDTEDRSSVRISSFQPQATQNYIDLSLSLYQDAARLTLPFNNASDLKKEYVVS